MSLPHVCSVCKDRRRIYCTTPPGEGWWNCPACFLASDGDYISVAPMDLRELCWHVLRYVPMDHGMTASKAAELIEAECHEERNTP